jgi:hypothetical protein
MFTVYSTRQIEGPTFARTVQYMELFTSIFYHPSATIMYSPSNPYRLTTSILIFRRWSHSTYKIDSIVYSSFERQGEEEEIKRISKRGRPLVKGGDWKSATNRSNSAAFIFSQRME